MCNILLTYYYTLCTVTLLTNIIEGKCNSYFIETIHLDRGLPLWCSGWGPVCQLGDVTPISSPGGFHMLWNDKACALKLLVPCSRACEANC